MTRRALTLAALTTAAATLLAVAFSPVHAQETPIPPAGPPAGEAWIDLTRADVQGAYALLRDNHPAARPELDDPAFIQRLERGRALALERAKQVRDQNGHRAVLSGFAAGMADGHIGYRTAFVPDLAWSGLMFSRADDGWRVGLHEVRPGETDLTGARLVDCDGQNADALADAWVGGFKADFSVEAEKRLKAFQLLIHDGNPFLTRPAACRFQLNGATVEHRLDWRATTRDAIIAHVPKVRRLGLAGFGLRPFAGGQWIAIQQLDERALPVIEAVKAQAETLRAAPVVVLDLRGNGGGSSSLGLDVAEALLGEPFVEARKGDDACAALWRASHGNIEAMKTTYRALDRGPEFAAWVEASIGGMERALAAGEPFDQSVPDCPARAPSQVATTTDAPASLFPGKLVLITDEACFSSCLLVTDAFRRFGALHLGHATQRGVRYMEVRHAPLPSGLGQFSTLQKAVVGLGDLGPYDPDVIHPGPMDEDAALEAWVAKTVAERR